MVSPLDCVSICDMASVAALEARLERLSVCAAHVYVAVEEQWDRFLYVIGGSDGNLLDRVERYDIVSGLWETLPSMSLNRSCAAAAVVRSRVCVVGGLSSAISLSSCTMYDPTASIWCDLPPMNKGRRCHGLVSVEDSHIYAFGGYKLVCMERLDVSALLHGGGGGSGGGVQWDMCPADMLNPHDSYGRYSFGYQIVSGSGAGDDATYIYCAGGCASVGRNLRDTQRYGLGRGVWEELPPLPDDRLTPGVVVVVGAVRDSDSCHVIAVVGGSRSTQRTVVLRSGRDESFASSAWEQVDTAVAADLGVPLEIRRQLMGAAMIDDRLALVGGYSGGFRVSEVVCCSSGDDAWGVPDMPLGGRSRVAVAVV